MIWLCQGTFNRLTPTAIEAIEGSHLRVSPMVMLELQYLYEIKKILQPSHNLLGQLEAQIGLTVCPHPFPAIIERALLESWTRDPFDRVIVAHARANKYSPLITADTEIRHNYPNTVWGPDPV